MKNRLDQIKKLLKQYNQEHLLHFYNKLNEEEQKKLLNQILEIDFDLINSLYRQESKENKKSIIRPIESTDINEISDKIEDYKKIGLNSLSKGEVAVVLLAGGQGTRLGHSGPKGTYNIGLPSNKSLFQLQCERLKFLSEKVGKYIPWYIMTSIDNHNETVNHFEKNDYFDYDKEMIKFFKQDALPIVSHEGKVMLESYDQIKLGSNGNGGCFSSLKTSGNLDDMSSKNIKWVFLYGVDNAIVKVADPVFIGYTIESGLNSSSKAVKKINPEEKVGVFCYKDNHPGIVEYSELSDEMRYAKDKNGELLYKDANILAHLFEIDILKDCAKESLPYHKANKKAPYINDKGEFVKSNEPNSYKFELFMFDVFARLQDMAILSVNREDEFSPVKNKEGNDSPKTARDMILQKYKKWLGKNSIDKSLFSNRTVEISPLKAYYYNDIDSNEIIEKLKNDNSDIIIIK